MRPPDHDVHRSQLVCRACRTFALRSARRCFLLDPAAFGTPSKLYLLGLNPGGSPRQDGEATIGKNLATWRSREPGWCEYTSERWEGAEPGEYGIQPPIRALFKRLGLNVADVPASNVVFVRSNNEEKLDRKFDLLPRCWPVHEAVIRDLGVTTVLCLGKTAGRWPSLDASC